MSELNPVLKEHLPEAAVNKLEELGRDDLGETLTILRTTIVASNLNQLPQDKQELAIELVRGEA